jgi:hypothetical protein
VCAAAPPVVLVEEDGQKRVRVKKMGPGAMINNRILCVCCTSITNSVTESAPINLSQREYFRKAP